jgi:hypothetical protein
MRNDYLCKSADTTVDKMAADKTADTMAMDTAADKMAFVPLDIEQTTDKKLPDWTSMMLVAGFGTETPADRMQGEMRRTGRSRRWLGTALTAFGDTMDSMEQDCNLAALATLGLTASDDGMSYPSNTKVENMMVVSKMVADKKAETVNTTAAGRIADTLVAHMSAAHTSAADKSAARTLAEHMSAVHTSEVDRFEADDT